MHPMSPLSSYFGYILLITSIICGLQLSWCTESSNITPFLLSLGVSKPTLSLIWMCCTITSILGQPVIGVLSDELRWKFGRRRPFIIAGALVVAAALISLSWSSEITSIFFEAEPRQTVLLASVSVVVLYFSIYVVDSSTRAFLVDKVASDKQTFANAVCACLAGLGNIVGYSLSSVDLPKLLPRLGHTQFQVLSSCAIIALVVTVPTACFFVDEADPTSEVLVQLEDDEYATSALRTDSAQSFSGQSVGRRLARVAYDMKMCFIRLSPQTKNMCIAEFFAVIAYFPLFIYTTTYIGEVYIDEYYSSLDPSLLPLDPNELQKLHEQATRRGSFALLLYSGMSLLGNLVMPLFVKNSDKNYRRVNNVSDVENIDNTQGQPSNHGNTILTDSETTPLLPTNTPLVQLLPRTSMPRLWFMCLVLFTLCIIATFFVHSTTGVTLIIGVLGIPWAASLWIPIALISEDIATLREKKQTVITEGRAVDSINAFRYEHEAGAVLGVHNMFVLVPQLISSVLSSVIFYLLQKEDANSIVWVFRVSGLSSFVAMYLSFYLKSTDELDMEYSQEEIR